MTIEEQAQILSEAVAETRAARHHYQGDIKEVVMPSMKNAGGLEFSMLGKRFTVEQSDFESIIN